MTQRLRVAIVGGRGIGKHHAKWFRRAGCDVTALYGTSPESAAAAAKAVSALIPFDGRVFSDWDQFLRDGVFDAASVCSPADAHCRNVLDLASAGRHILCEKPLAWDWDRTPGEMVEQGRAMLAAVRENGVVLAVNAQYPAALEGYRHLHRELRGRDPDFPRLSYWMETKGQPRSPHGPAEVWVDLGPHPLAFLDAVAPGGAVQWETLKEQGSGFETRVEFVWRSSQGDLPVDMTLRRVPGGNPVRRVGNGDLDCAYEGANVDGEFVAVMRANGSEWVGLDFMRTSVERFVDAALTGDETLALVTGDAGLRQLEALVGVWSRSWYQPSPAGAAA